MVYTFARISAVVAMQVEDYFPNGKRWWCGCRRKAASATRCRRITSSSSSRTNISPRPTSAIRIRPSLPLGSRQDRDIDGRPDASAAARLRATGRAMLKAESGAGACASGFLRRPLTYSLIKHCPKVRPQLVFGGYDLEMCRNRVTGITRNWNHDAKIACCDYAEPRPLEAKGEWLSATVPVVWTASGEE
jgi:hypothetical protein